MQPTEGFSVQRRALDVEDYIDILRRHKGWIFGPFLLTLVGSVVGAHLYPDSYESVALVQIRRQQVSEAVVQSMGNQDILDRVNSLAQQVMSRGQLTTMITTLNLYPKERVNQPLQQVIERMKLDVHFDPLPSLPGARGVPAFKVRFSYPNRFDAQKLVGALTSKFIDEDHTNRDSNSFQTKSFIQDQTELAKKKLDEIDGKIAAFRMQNQGRLPDQFNSNLSSLTSLQSNMQYLSSASGRAAGEKMQMETAIRSYNESLAALNRDSTAVANTVRVPVKSAKLVSTERQLEDLETGLTVLLKTFTENHNEVKRVRNLISIAEAKRDQAAAEDAAQKKDEPPPTNPGALQRELQVLNIKANIDQVQAQIKIKEQEIADLEKNMKATTEQIKLISSRVEAMPIGDQVWGEMIREQIMAKDQYIRQSENLSKAQISVDLEGRSQGERLELLDTANLPENPTAPNRPMVISVGAGLGLLLGIVLAGAREVKDTSLKNLKDVRAYTQMAILGSVPLLENDFVVRRRRRIAWLGWTVACLASVLIMVGSVVYYYQTKP